jgi:hypothetical protein
MATKTKRADRFTGVTVGVPRPFNPAFHFHAVALLGAQHDRVPAYWEDTGDAENGPELSGFQEHDRYTLDDISFAMFSDGTFDWCEQARVDEAIDALFDLLTTTVAIIVIE